MMRTVWVGYSCADAGRTRLASAVTTRPSFDRSAMRILHAGRTACVGHADGLLQAAVPTGQASIAAKPRGCDDSSLRIGKNVMKRTKRAAPAAPAAGSAELLVHA